MTRSSLAELQSLDDSPFFSLFFEEKNLSSRKVILLPSLFHLQVELLDDGGGFSVDLDGSVPARIGNPVETPEISPDPLLKSVEVLPFILVRSGDARKVKGEVFVLEGLLSSVQSLIYFLFFRTLAG